MNKLLVLLVVALGLTGCASPKTTATHFTVNDKHQWYCVYNFMPQTWCDWSRKTNWDYTIYELNEPYPDFR